VSVGLASDDTDDVVARIGAGGGGSGVVDGAMLGGGEPVQSIVAATGELT